MKRIRLRKYLVIFLIFVLPPFYFLLKKVVKTNPQQISKTEKLPVTSIAPYPSDKPNFSIEMTPIASPTSIPVPTPIPTPDIFTGYTKQQFYITFYGWPDNDPPGNVIAYPKSRYSNSIHDFAGGVGTYKNPITFASDPEHIAIGKIYYVISLRKYIVMEDYCSGCLDSWDFSEKHIDIWMESDSNFKDELLVCQRNLTQKNVEVIVDPPTTLPVDTKALFNKHTGECVI